MHVRSSVRSRFNAVRLIIKQEKFKKFSIYEYHTESNNPKLEFSSKSINTCTHFILFLSTKLH